METIKQKTAYIKLFLQNVLVDTSQQFAVFS